MSVRNEMQSELSSLPRSTGSFGGTVTIWPAAERVEPRAAGAKLVFALAFALGVTYVLRWPSWPHAGSSVLKATPDLLLMALAVRLPLGRERVLAVLAYALAAVGDVFLDFDRTVYLKQALMAFFVSQTCFTGVFLSRARWMPKRLPWVALLVVLAAPVIIGGWENFGPMRPSVIVFVLGLVAMGWAAVMVPGNPYVGAGAVLWVIADLLIGVNRFVAPAPYWTPIILTIYTVAIHLLIGWGILFRAPARARRGRP